MVDYSFGLVWEEDGLHADPVKAGNEHDDAHIDELLDEYLSEASLLFLVLCVLLLELAQLLIKIGNVLIDEHS